jgi:hypothetical protein
MKKHICSSCDAHFSTAFLLDRHRREHKKNIRKRECRICHWNAQTALTLENHIRTKHPTIMAQYKHKHKCLLCNFSAKTAFVRDRHMNITHSEPEAQPSLLDAIEIIQTIAAIGIFFY